MSFHMWNVNIRERWEIKGNSRGKYNNNVHLTPYKRKMVKLVSNTTTTIRCTATTYIWYHIKTCPQTTTLYMINDRQGPRERINNIEAKISWVYITVTSRTMSCLCTRHDSPGIQYDSQSSCAVSQCISTCTYIDIYVRVYLHVRT